MAKRIEALTRPPPGVTVPPPRPTALDAFVRCYKIRRVTGTELDTDAKLVAWIERRSEQLSRALHETHQSLGARRRPLAAYQKAMQDLVRQVGAMHSSVPWEAPAMLERVLDRVREQCAGWLTAVERNLAKAYRESGVALQDEHRMMIEAAALGWLGQGPRPGAVRLFRSTDLNDVKDLQFASGALVVIAGEGLESGGSTKTAPARFRWSQRRTQREGQLGLEIYEAAGKKMVPIHLGRPSDESPAQRVTRLQAPLAAAVRTAFLRHNAALPEKNSARLALLAFDAVRRLMQCGDVALLIEVALMRPEALLTVVTGTRALRQRTTRFDWEARVRLERCDADGLPGGAVRGLIAACIRWLGDFDVESWDDLPALENTFFTVGEPCYGIRLRIVRPGEWSVEWFTSTDEGPSA